MRLRRAIERIVPDAGGVAESVAGLSSAYRSGRPAAPLDTPALVTAYAAARMPATFAAAARAVAWAADRAPGFVPRTHLDVGGGTGAAAWAARTTWPSIESTAIVDRERATLDLGRRLASQSGDPALLRATWDVDDATHRHEPADLVTASYVLGELGPASLEPAIDALWSATTGMLVIVEPGSRAGYGRVIAARDRLIAAGARVVAPCPGPEPCPVAGSRSTWCHFLARLDRSPGHRRAKRATRSWEDEPFSYVALARPEVVADPRPRVVLGRPRHHPGRVELRICADGRIERRVVSRRERDAWREARDLEWGDPIVPPGDAAAT